MDIQEFRNRALESIRVVNAKLRHSVSEDASQFDLTDTQVFLLGFLKEKGKANIGEIAAEFNSDCANISPTCKKLEKLGFLHRSRSTEDERVVFVTLSVKGEEIVAEVFGKLDAKLKTTFGGTNKRDAENTLDDLKKLSGCFDWNAEV